MELLELRIESAVQFPSFEEMENLLVLVKTRYTQMSQVLEPLLPTPLVHVVLECLHPAHLQQHPLLLHRRRYTRNDLRFLLVWARWWWHENETAHSLRLYHVLEASGRVGQDKFWRSVYCLYSQKDSHRWILVLHDCCVCLDFVTHEKLEIILVNDLGRVQKVKGEKQMFTVNTFWDVLKRFFHFQKYKK
jgi:hypothetical protein